MKLNFKDIDKPTFIATFVILLAICIPLMINPVKGSYHTKIKLMSLP